MDEFSGSFSKRIKMVRAGTGLSQQKFGDSLGVGQQHIYFLEAGKRRPSNLLIVALSAVHDVDINWLRNGQLF